MLFRLFGGTGSALFGATSNFDKPPRTMAGALIPMSKAGQGPVI